MSNDSYENTVLATGFYPKPHGLVEMVKDKFITKAEYILLDLLLHLENRHTRQSNEWFFCLNEELCKTNIISKKTLIKARIGLKEKGLIDFKNGYSHHATDYRILIDGKYYYRGGDFSS